MKKNLFSMWLGLTAILFSVNMHAQMTIGGKKEPEAFSVLELLNKGGLRLPQMTTAERDAFAVQGNAKGNGLTIYNKTTGCVDYWNGTKWVSLCDQAGVSSLIAADNGLTATTGKVQLGGSLLKPTVLVTTSANTLAVQGLQAGAASDNVLVADANGVLKWITRAAFGGDNLGNHTATQDLVMSSKNITGAANVTASGTITGANLTATTKTTTPAAQITTGAGAGKVAVSDASGNLTWTDPSTITAKGDNLGNHTATTDLNMSSKNIDNIFNANIKNGAVLFDRTSSNTNYFSFYKQNGSFSIFNSLKAGVDLIIDEVTSKTGVNNLSIYRGTDGSVPAAGSVAVSADGSGNVIWKPASSIGAGDNLGNHTATQDLVMSSKNITGAANITASGTITGANLMATTKTTTPAAQITTGAGAGKVAVSDASGNLTWTDPATIAVTGDNLGNHTATQALNMSNKDITNIATATLGTLNVKTGINMKDGIAGKNDYFYLYKENGVLNFYNTVNGKNVLTIDDATSKTSANNFQIQKGTDGAAPATGYIATAADANGNVIWKSASSIGAGDNLGNHTATQDLVMSSKNITGAANITASGTITGANLTATTKTTTPAAQITTGAGAGKVAVSDASGNLTWTDPSTITAKGDNLGNHTATTDLNMSSKNIDNIFNANIKNGAVLFDRTSSNTNYFSLYKQNGSFSIFNSLKAGVDLSIDEATRKTGVNNLSIYRGTDGSVPAAGSVAVSADGSGNVIWKPAASIGAGDNLGNHTATQALTMGANVINFNKVDASKIQFYNSADGARLENSSGYVLKSVAGFKGESAGQFTWANYSGAGTTEAEVMRLNGSGNLGIGTQPTNRLHVKAAADPVKIEGLSVSSNSGDVSLVISTDGTVKKAISAPGARARYSTSVASGASQAVNLTINPEVSLFTITTDNGCGRVAIATFQSAGDVITFTGGQARSSIYESVVLDANGASLRLTAPNVSGCGDGSDSTQFNFDIIKSGNTLTIKNNGNVGKTYTIKQSEL